MGTALAPHATATTRPAPGPDHQRRWTGAVLLVEGIALVPLVTFRGAPGWSVVRAAVVIALTVGAIAVDRSRFPWPGIVRTTAGLAGVVLGAAIGVSFTVRAGWSLAGAAGLVVLAAGAVLLVDGTIVLVRGVHGWRRLLSIPVAFVVLQFVAVPVFGALVITHVPPDAGSATTPADLGLAFEEVSFTTSDDVRLSAWYLPSSTGAAVLLLAGSGSGRAALLDHAAVLARNGYGALLLDNRGHGRSGGVGMDVGWFATIDVAAATAYLASRPDVDPSRIGVVGLSMGGEQAVTAAASNRTIRAVVAEGATGRDSADLVPGPGLAGAIERVTSWSQFRLADLLTDASTPEPLVSAAGSTAPTPVLLIAGAGELAANERMQAAAPSSIQLWNLPDTAHTGALGERPAEWESRVIGFLDAALAPS
jgi:dienelactone hydrolase